MMKYILDMRRPREHPLTKKSYADSLAQESKLVTCSQPEGYSRMAGAQADHSPICNVGLSLLGLNLKGNPEETNHFGGSHILRHTRVLEAAARTPKSRGGGHPSSCPQTRESRSPE